MTEHDGIGQAGITTLLGERVTVAHAAGVNSDQRLAEAGLGNIALHQLKVGAGIGYLNCPHPRHIVATSRFRVS
jgi:hypothetical protein